MINKITGRHRLLLPLLFSAMLVLLLPACVEEIAPPNNDDETTITFSVNTPKDFSPTSYALTIDDEDNISTVDVLLFKDGNYFSGPHYGILNGSEVTIRIPSSAENYNMAVFANCRAELNQAFTTSLTKANVLASLTRTVAAGNADDGLVGGVSAGWLTTDGNKTIPMYGEYTAGQTVNLVRMLARINVSIANEDNDGNPITVPFTLSEVYLCNYNSKGQIAPASNWTESTPTIVSGVQQIGFDKSIKYTAVTDNKLEREIYTFEANAGDAANLPTNTCLVIGGEYNSSSTTTYYRIDFVNTTDTYLPLLRNHTYETVVSKIGGSGYNSPAEAFASRPVNIEYDIVDWDGSEVVNVVYDGQYMLGVSQNSFTFDKSERTASSADNTITVTTNFPTAWTVSVPSQSHANWLTAAKQADNNTILLTCGVNNENTSRTAIVRITAGRMVQDISVTQIKDEVSISFGGTVPGDELYFESKAGEVPAEKGFILSWTPSGATPTYTSNFTTGTINGSSLSSSGTVSQSNGASVPVQPTAISVSDFNSGITERTSVVTYQLSYGGATVNKILKIRQKATRPSFDPLPISINKASYYPRTGTTEKFFITSTSGSVSWKVKSFFGVTSVTPSGTATTTTSTNPGNIVEFTTDNNPSTYNQAVIVLASSDGTKETTVTLDIGGPYTPTTSASNVVWAGSNIYYDEGKQILTFDTGTTNQAYQGLFFQWGSLWGVSPANSPSALYDPSTTPVYKATDEAPIPTSGSAGGAWSSIPYLDTSYDTGGSNGAAERKLRAYLYELTGTKISDVPVGDICKWLTDKGWAPGSKTGTRWRMPTTNDFETGGSYSNPIDGSEYPASNITNITDATGKYQVVNSASGKYPGASRDGVFFPAAGSRHYSSGGTDNVGRYGNCWSSSPYNNSIGYNLGILFSGTVNLSGYNYRTYGFPVRCVKEN